MFQFTPPQVDIISLLPVIIIAVTGALGLLLEIFNPHTNNKSIAILSGFGIVIAALFTVFGMDSTVTTTYGDLLLRDGFGSVVCLILLLVALLTVFFSEAYLREKEIPYGEFYPLMLWSTAGAMIMVTTYNFLMIFIGLEVLSISLYVLSGLSRSEEKSEESAIKYFLLGAFSSGFLLYGIAFFFGGTSSLSLESLSTLSFLTIGTGSTSHTLVLTGIGLILVGLCFKSSMVPFHQWTPDVYQGAPTNVTAFMSATSKVAALTVFSRVLVASHAFEASYLPVLFCVAILTMVVGNFAALAQKDVKRILAYSSISHSGYILVAILAQPYGVSPDHSTLLYYLLSYSVMIVGSFAALTALIHKGQEDTSLASLNGLWKRNPINAFCLLILMLSLVGLPPFSGFFAKVLIFKDALGAGLLPLAIVLALTSIVSAAYYLRIAYSAFVSEPEGVQLESKNPLGAQVTCILAAAGVLLMSVFLSPITQFFNR